MVSVEGNRESLSIHQQVRETSLTDILNSKKIDRVFAEALLQTPEATQKRSRHSKRLEKKRSKERRQVKNQFLEVSDSFGRSSEVHTQVLKSAEELNWKAEFLLKVEVLMVRKQGRSCQSQKPRPSTDSSSKTADWRFRSLEEGSRNGGVRKSWIQKRRCWRLILEVDFGTRREVLETRKEVLIQDGGVMKRLKSRRDDDEEELYSGGGVELDVGADWANFEPPGKILLVGIHTLMLSGSGGKLVGYLTWKSCKIWTSEAIFTMKELRYGQTDFRNGFST